MPLHLRVDGAAVHIDSDALGATFDPPGPGPRLRYDGLHVEDARGQPIPARLVARSGGFTIEPDALALSGASFPVHVDPWVTLVGDAFTGGQDGAHLGFRVGAAGDVDGDGYDDAWATTQFWDGPAGQDTGLVRLYVGSASGLDPSWSWAVEGGAFGRVRDRAAGAGDVNGDGYGDLLVGMPLDDTAGNDAGAVELYLGSATGLAGSPSWTLQCTQAGGKCGWDVSSAGDTNADGYADVLVGAPTYDNAQDAEGMAFLWYGGALGPDGGAPSSTSTDADWSAESNQVGAQMGASVTTVWDANGDGSSDVVIGAPYWDGAVQDGGRASLYLGSPAGLSSTSSWTREGTQVAAVGWELAGVGDLSGDGFADLAIGQPFYSNNLSGEGRVQIILGTAAGLAASAVRTWDGGEDSAMFGASLTALGDVNGDGFSDLLVGASGGNAPYGSAKLYLGALGGPEVAPGWTGAGVIGSNYGTSVGGAGDCNGDGFADWLVGANNTSTTWSLEGSVTPYFGSADALSVSGAVASTSVTNAQFAAALANAGDVNGDGFDDLLIGSPAYGSVQTAEGRALIYQGTVTGPAASASWQVESNVTDLRMGASVAGAGDVNGDGYDDVLVGSDAVSDTTGALWLYLGSSSGVVSTPAWSVTGAAATGNLGFGVAGAGDVNGDGFADVLAGAPLYDNGSNYDAGALSAWYGSASGLPSASSWFFTPPGGGLDLGWSVAGAGDVNGDGYDDALAGAPWQDASIGTDEVGVWAFYGSATGLPTAASWVVTSGQQNSLLGWSVTGAGDVNGDGYSDVIAGEPYAAAAFGDMGRARLWLGSAGGLASAHAWAVFGGYSGGYGGWHLGRAVRSAGDVDRDGFGDVLVGAPQGSMNWGVEGVAHLYRGSSSGLSTTAQWTADPADYNNTNFGIALAAGDWDGDGFSDPVVGASTHAIGGSRWWYRGGSVTQEGAAWSPRLRVLQVDGTTPLPTGGRADSDAVRARILARSPFGVTRVRLAVEAQGRGTAFGDQAGLPVVHGAAWQSSGTAGLTLTESVGGLPLQEDIHLRARAEGDPSQGTLVTGGAWQLAGPGGEPLGAHLRVPFVDADADGAGADVDCDDGDPISYPGAPELCDMVDQDCDDDVLEAFPDLDMDLVLDCVDPDADEDGFEAGWAGGTDCDDLDPNRSPVAPESCDALDSDCDGSLVDEFPDLDLDQDPDCTDADDDGDGDPDATDCDDANALVHVGAAEACDAVDANCDGSLVDGFVDTDNDLAPDCIDADDDGDGDADGTDCAPLDSGRYSGAPEACDDVDSDCDGALVDGFADADADGEPDCIDTNDDGDPDPDATDCAPLDPTIYHLAPDPCDAVDQDCDGSVVESFADTDGDLNPDCSDPDDDGDGSPDGTDCAPLDPAIFPNAVESCDNVDGDCDGSLVDSFANLDADTLPDCVDDDDDGDTWTDAPGPYQDCDDGDASVHPFAPDSCDGTDNDCDGDLECSAGDDDTTPGDDDTTPGDDDSAAGDDDSATGDDDSGLGDDDATPGDDDLTPGDDDSGDDDSGDDDSGDDDSGDDDSGDDDSGDDDSGDDDAGDDDAGDDDGTQGDDDVTGREEPRGIDMGPGFVLSCGCAAGGPGTGILAWAAPWLVLAAWRLRRRRWESLVPFLLLVMLTLPNVALAGQADELAVESKDLLDKWCTDADSGDPDRATRAMEPLGGVLGRLTAFLDERGVADFGWLRYWRGRVAFCLQRADLATADFSDFVSTYARQPTFRSMADDARRRLRRLGVKVPDVEEPATTLPALSIGLGGGFQRLGHWNWAAFSLDVQIRLRGPLHALVVVEPSLGPPGVYEDDGTPLPEPKRPLLLQLGGGLSLRFDLPVRPELGVGVLLGPSPPRDPSEGWLDDGGPVLLAPFVRGGFCIPFGRSPVGVRLLVEGPGAPPFPAIRAIAALVLQP